MTSSSDNRFPSVEFWRMCSPNPVIQMEVFPLKIHSIKFPSTIDRLCHCKIDPQPCEQFTKYFLKRLMKSNGMKCDFKNENMSNKLTFLVANNRVYRTWFCVCSIVCVLTNRNRPICT